MKSQQVSTKQKKSSSKQDSTSDVAALKEKICLQQLKLQALEKTVELKYKEAAHGASVGTEEGARSKQEDNEEDQESGAPSYLLVCDRYRLMSMI